VFTVTRVRAEQRLRGIPWVCGIHADIHNLVFDYFAFLKLPLRPIILQTKERMHRVQINVKSDFFGNVLGLGQFIPGKDLIQRLYIQISLL